MVYVRLYVAWASFGVHDVVTAWRYVIIGQLYVARACLGVLEVVTASRDLLRASFT